MKLSTKDFRRAKMPFGWFLLYSQLTAEKRAAFELLFETKVNLLGQKFKAPKGDSKA